MKSIFVPIRFSTYAASVVELDAMLSAALYVPMPEALVKRILTIAGSPPLVSDTVLYGAALDAPPTVQLWIVNIEASSPVIVMLEKSSDPDAVPVL